MAHNITSRDAVFSVREPGWHGLAEVLDEYPTAEEARKLVHPWEPVAEDVYRSLDLATLRKELARVIYDGPHTTQDQMFDQMMARIASAQQGRIVPGAKLNARSDDGYPLGLVTDTFQTVTNAEMWEIAEAIEKGDTDRQVRYETGGSLRGGRKVWLLIRMAEPIVISGDPRGASIPYYALQNAHDGSGSFRGQATFTRIICDNTAQAADLDAGMRGTEMVFHHTKNIRERIEEAREALEGWRASVEDWRLFSEHMAAQPVTPEQARDFLVRFIPEPPGQDISEIVRGNIEHARNQWYECWNGPTCEGIKGTAHGLVQASIEYSQHYRKAQNRESAFKRAYLDRSKLTAKAVELAREAVHA